MQFVQETTPMIGDLLNITPAEKSLRVLNDAELEVVAGGLGPVGAAVGAGLAAVGYGVNAAFTGSGSWTGFGIAVGTGAAVGAMPASAVGYVWGFNATVAGATMGGVNSLW